MPERISPDELERQAREIADIVREGYAPPGTHVGPGERNALTVYAERNGVNQSTMQDRVRLMMRPAGLHRLWHGIWAEPKKPTADHARGTPARASGG